MKEPFELGLLSASQEITSSLTSHLLLVFIASILVNIGEAADAILPSCHNLYTEPEGLITSPGYPNNYPPQALSCNLDIQRQPRSCGVRLTFEDFELRQPDHRDGFCKIDYLSVDFCVPEGGNRFCGQISTTTYEYAFQEEAQHFRLVFKTNAANTTEQSKKGFQIRYKVLSDCRKGLYWNPPISTIPGIDEPQGSQCYTQVTESKGTINTPYFPKRYPNNMDCVYEFLRESPLVCGIRMKVLTFDLEDSITTELGGACSDFFHLVGGCGFICGQVRFTWTAKYQPGALSLRFHFHSDERKTRPGFQIAFEQVYSCP